MKKEGVTILLVEQNANKALSIAHHAYVLETGNITVSGERMMLQITHVLEKHIIRILKNHQEKYMLKTQKVIIFINIHKIF